MLEYKTESSSHRIPRLLEAVLDGAPLGNLDAAIAELSARCIDYRKIKRWFDEVLPSVSNPYRRAVLSDASSVLASAISEITDVLEKIAPLSKNFNRKHDGKVLAEAIAIIKWEISEINKVLLELCRLGFFNWPETKKSPE
jgi:hypothetical protein